MERYSVDQARKRISELQNNIQLNDQRDSVERRHVADRVDDLERSRQSDLFIRESAIERF